MLDEFRMKKSLRKRKLNFYESQKITKLKSKIVIITNGRIFIFLFFLDNSSIYCVYIQTADTVGYTQYDCFHHFCSQTIRQYENINDHLIISNIQRLF